MSEEQRAIEYRRMMAARARNKAIRERALSGSSVVYAAFRARWQPMIDWLDERNHDDGGREDDEDPGQILNVNG